MAKGRMLQNRISKSQKMASLSNDTVRLLYTWMLSHLDVNGNFYADPVMVNNLVFTRLGHPVKIIASALNELEEKGLIIRYQINGDIYLNYPDFHEKQPSINPIKEGTPDIPPLTQESIITSNNLTQELIQRHSSVTDTLREGKLREDKLREDKATLASFETFWEEYPRKVNKKEALDKWKKANLPSLEKIITVLKKHKSTEEWEKDNGKYIPYPSTWINKERWNDQIIGGHDGTDAYIERVKKLSTNRPAGNVEEKLAAKDG